MCARCHDTGLRTMPPAPPDADGEYSTGHVLAWHELMRRLGNVVRLWNCRCRRGKHLLV